MNSQPSLNLQNTNLLKCHSGEAQIIWIFWRLVYNFSKLIYSGKENNYSCISLRDRHFLKRYPKMALPTIPFWGHWESWSDSMLTPAHWRGITQEGSSSLHVFPRMMHQHHWSCRVLRGFRKFPEMLGKVALGFVSSFTPQGVYLLEISICGFRSSWETLRKGHKWNEWKENHCSRPLSGSNGALAFFLPFAPPTLKVRSRTM